MDTARAYAKWGKASLRARLGHSRKAAQGTKHLLLIASDFPPYVSGGIYRPLALTRYAIQHGWRVTVLTYETRDNAFPSGTRLLESVPKEVRVLRIAQPTVVPSYNWFPKIQGESLLQAIDLFEGAAHVLADDPPSVVMATAPLFYSFAAGRLLSRYFGKKLVIDYRDEWTQWPFGIFTIGRSDHVWEARCLRDADLVFFTTEAQRANQLLAFPRLDRAKCHLVPNGWEPADFKSSTDGPEVIPPPLDSIVLTHAGVFGGHINSIGFLEALKQVLDSRPDLQTRLTLHLVGIKDAKTLTYLSTFPHAAVIKMTDQVAKSDAARLMKSSTGLLLIYSGSFERYIPGKLYDYLAAGLPILVFGEQGEACDIVRQFRTGVIVPPGRPEALAAALDQLGARQPDSARDSPGLTRWLNEHTRDNMSKRMLDFVDAL